jgi:hypothetical protein
MIKDGKHHIVQPTVTQLSISTRWWKRTVNIVAKNGLKLIVSFPIPLRSTDMTDDDFKEVTDEVCNLC